MTSKSQIVDPKRILRVLQKMCFAKMSVLIKLDAKSITGIRGQLSHIDELNGKTLLFIDQVSEMGLKLLANKKSCKIEVIGMPSRVVFLGNIKQRLAGGIKLALPQSIVSIERRQNTRYLTTTNYVAYVKFEDWFPEISDLASPPLVTPFEHMASWVLLSDISIGGACGITSYPSISNEMAKREGAINCQIMMPMVAPIKAKCLVKWRKKTTNRSSDGFEGRAKLEFRIGLEFFEPSEDLQMRLKQFMRQLSMAQAI